MSGAISMSVSPFSGSTSNTPILRRKKEKNEESGRQQHTDQNSRSALMRLITRPLLPAVWSHRHPRRPRCAVRISSTDSVMIALTHLVPVSGSLHELRILGLPPLAVCSIVTTTRLPDDTKSIAPPMASAINVIKKKWKTR